MRLGVLYSEGMFSGDQVRVAGVPLPRNSSRCFAGGWGTAAGGKQDVSCDDCKAFWHLRVRSTLLHARRQRATYWGQLLSNLRRRIRSTELLRALPLRALVTDDRIFLELDPLRLISRDEAHVACGLMIVGLESIVAPP